MSSTTRSATNWAAITPNDATVLTPRPVALYVGADGNVVAAGDNGATATFAVLAGQVLTIQPSKVLATGTTATGIVALYNSL